MVSSFWGKMTVSKRTNLFTESIIREMTRIHYLYGGVNLAQGFPDFPTPQPIKEAAIAAIHDDWNQYSITWGSPRLREAIANKVNWFPGLEVDPEKNITITCGATEAITSSLMAILDPGDEIIFFEPFYENYRPSSILAGAKPVFVSLYPPKFSFNPTELRDAFNSKTKAILINTPNNPTGKVFTYDELSFIAQLCLEFDAIAITDEVYEHITYDGIRHIAMASLPEMFERTITCNSLSKTYCATGWRIGYVIARSDISDAIRKVHDFTTLGAPAPLQEGAVTAFNLPKSYYTQLAEDYQKRRDLFLKYLDEAGLPYTKPQGSYYVMADLSEFSFEGGMEVAIWLLKEIGVAGVPGFSFFRDPQMGKHLIRFHFSKSDQILHDAGQRLCRLRDKF